MLIRNMAGMKLFVLVAFFLAISFLLFSVIAALNVASEPSTNFSKMPVITRENLIQYVNIDTSVRKDTDIFFSPSKIKLTVNDPISVDVVVNTRSNKLTAVQLELLFDPSHITDVFLQEPHQSSLFVPSDYVVLFKEVDKKNGRIRYAIGVKPGNEARSGEGSVLHLIVTPNPRAKGKTILAFSTDTLAVEPGRNASVIKNLTPLYLTF